VDAPFAVPWAPRRVLWSWCRDRGRCVVPSSDTWRTRCCRRNALFALPASAPSADSPRSSGGPRTTRATSWSSSRRARPSPRRVGNAVTAIVRSMPSALVIVNRSCAAALPRRRHVGSLRAP